MFVASVNRGPVPLASVAQSAGEVFELFRRFNRERGCAVLLVTHDPRLSATCDRTIELVDGHIVSDAMNA